MSFNYLKINEKNLKKNIEIIRKESNNEKLCLPVKANAYGHGIAQIVEITKDIVDYFAVADLHEALKVNEIYSHKPVLIFGSIDFNDLHLACDNFHFSIQDDADITLLESFFCNVSNKVKVHININTGMNRMGVNYDNHQSLILKIYNSENINLVGVYSHLACADDKYHSQNIIQTQRFKIVYDYVKKLDSNILCHLANSCGLLGQPNISYDMIRPGILSYGYLPQLFVNEQFKNITPIAKMISSVVKINSLKDDFLGVGYSHKYRGLVGGLIATIPVGYGDGYFRAFGGKCTVIINGGVYDVVGVVSMDAIAVLIDKNSGISIGDEVVLISDDIKHANSVSSLAKISNTIENDVITSITNRVCRVIV